MCPEYAVFLSKTDGLGALEAKNGTCIFPSPPSHTPPKKRFITDLLYSGSLHKILMHCKNVLQWPPDSSLAACYMFGILNHHIANALRNCYRVRSLSQAHMSELKASLAVKHGLSRVPVPPLGAIMMEKGPEESNACLKSVTGRRGNMAASYFCGLVSHLRSVLWDNCSPVP